MAKENSIDKASGLISDPIPERYTVRHVLNMALKHKKQLVSAHLIAIMAVLASIPIPLLIPLLIDEVYWISLAK